MKIVVLNESFLNPIHLERLKALGDVEVYEGTSTEEEVIERAKDADVAVVDCYIAPLNAKVFENLEKTKLVTLNSTGFDPVDTAAATANGVQVADVPEFSTDAVAEHAIGLMFAAIRHIALGDKEVRNKPFQIDPGDKTQRHYAGFNVRGKTLGIVGLGNIGSRTAEIGQGLGMRVIGYNRSPKEIPNVELKGLEEVLKESDVVSLHVAYNPELKDLIGKEELSQMKPTAVLINTARGDLVSTEALHEALTKGTIAGAGLDVLAEWDKSNPLLPLKNVVFTPHAAFFTQEALDNMAEIIVQNIEAFAKGKPINLVN